MKKIITLALILVLAISLAVAIGAADRRVIGKYEAEDDSKEVSWVMYFDGELVISGKTSIPNYNGATADWMAYAEKIQKITIKDGVTGIGRCAFYNIINLEKVTIPDSVETIGMPAFYRCIKLKSVSIPGTRTSIGAEACGGCSNLKEIELGYGIENIRASAFSKCKKLETITIPKSVKSIGEDAFKGCEDLREVYLRPTTAPELGADAFDGVDEDVFVIFYPKSSSGYTKGEWKTYYTETYTPAASDDEVEEVMLGDVNGDDKVSDKDNSALIEFLIGKTDEINTATADVDGDGKVTIADSVYLARYLDGWKEYKL